MSITTNTSPTQPTNPSTGRGVDAPKTSSQLAAEGSQLRRRGLARLSAAAVLCVAAFGLAPAGAQETIEEARERQEQLAQEELLARTELHIVNAELYDVQAAYDAAVELVRRQEAEVTAAQLELDAAELRSRQIDVAIGWADYDMSQLSDAIVETAVEAYLGDAKGEGTTLLQSNNIQEGATRIAMLELASSEAEDVVDVVRGIKERQTALVEEQDELIERITLIEAELRTELDELEANREIREELRAEVEGRVAEWQSQVDEIEAEDAELESFIANKQALAAGQQPEPSDVSTEGYIWPTAGGVASGFGPRLHPILGYYRLHSGMDIGGAHGAGIFAANSGTVIVAGRQGGYGNTIVIDHGEGLSSLYAHQSKFAVGVGAEVNRGDLIGHVGSTGMSTGPHLHFEIRLYGTPIDPMPFLR